MTKALLVERTVETTVTVETTAKLTGKTKRITVKTERITVKTNEVELSSR